MFLVLVITKQIFREKLNLANAAANAFWRHTPKDFFENEIYSDKPFLSRFVLESELF